MRDRSTPPHDTTTGSLATPLSYRAPGADQKSQWITDDGPGGGWLVGCLIALGVVGAVVAAVVGVITYFFTGF